MAGARSSERGRVPQRRFSTFQESTRPGTEAPASPRRGMPLGKRSGEAASGAAPQAASPDRFPNGIPLRGLAGASVPGLVDSWKVLNRRWGTRPLSELLAPAIAYAADGFPAAYRYSQRFAEAHRSEEHTSELQSRFGISYAVFCLKKKKTH